jgi:exopolyphosphatase/guanosine-5'-triphosphate,3'-diphosphate pyrophosphatase
MGASDRFKARGFPERGASPRRAVVDLGSNTFHLLLADVADGAPRVVERVRVRCGLQAGVRADGTLDDAALARADAALAHLAGHLADLPVAARRIVGTSALRGLGDPDPVRALARRHLGVDCEILGGADEARLIHRGALATLPDARGPHLVVDIGGGSTEFALGEAGAAAPRVLSLDLGCVRQRGAPGPAAEVLDAARARARAVLDDPRLDAFVPTVGTTVVGTSGTFESVMTVLARAGEPAPPVTRAALAGLCERLAAGGPLPRPLPGLDPDREDVFPAGLAILDAIVERLGLETLVWAPGSLEDGVLAETLGAEPPS